MRRREFIKTTASAALAPVVMSGPLQQARAAKEKAGDFRDRIKPITAEERLGRLEKAHELMREYGIDALLFEGGVTLNYFTGINWWRSERLFAMILPRNGEPQYVAPKFEESRAAEQVGKARLLTWEEDESPYPLIKQVLKDNNILTGRLGVEETVRYFVVEHLHMTLGSMQIQSATPVTAGCRSVKSKHEIELIQIANDITREAYTVSLPALKEGMSPGEFSRILSRNFSELGAGGGAMVLFGTASSNPHGTTKEEKLRNGSIVLMDGGCSVEGYSSDVTRTTVFGKPSEKMKKVWGIVRKTQDAAFAAARPGVPAEEIDAAARKVVTDAGYGPGYRYFTHRLGHGIGMEGHEWYYLVRGSKRKVQPGNIFTNEPGIYIPGEFGLRLEDEMLITENGSRPMLPQATSLDDLF